MAKSKAAIFRQRFIGLANSSQGSEEEIWFRRCIAQEFIKFMRASGINLHHINNVKIKYIERYFTYRYHQGVKAVVLQRELSALQAILAEAGQSIKADPEHPRLNPQALGIAGSRPEVICPYCNCSASLVKGCEIYPHRAELAEQFYWICPQCKAYSGCHKGQGRPRGTLANEELRQLRRKVHWLFDPMWKNTGIKREDGYVWLARKLNIPLQCCHIGLFDVELCQRAIGLLQSNEILLNN